MKLQTPHNASILLSSVASSIHFLSLSMFYFYPSMFPILIVTSVVTNILHYLSILLAQNNKLNSSNHQVLPPTIGGDPFDLTNTNVLASPVISLNQNSNVPPTIQYLPPINNEFNQI